MLRRLTGPIWSRREIGLIDEASPENEAFPEIEPGTPGANAKAKDVVGIDYSTNILAYSALSENGRAIRSQEMQRLLLGYRDNMRVEVETGIAVTAKNRSGSSRANRLAGRFGLKHPCRP